MLQVKNWNQFYGESHTPGIWMSVGKGRVHRANGAQWCKPHPELGDGFAAPQGGNPD